MIRNEREYRITKAQARKFKEALATLERGGDEEADIHPVLMKAQRDALASQLGDLQRDIRSYEALKSGKRRRLSIDTFEDLSQVLIQARIARGFTQRQLAERLGLKEQQIQRYEASAYASANLERITEILRALGLKVSVSIPLPRREESLAS